jgi:hypothetical protein
MQHQPPAGKALTAEQRQQLEAYYAYKRLYELALDPVRGNFDAAHLKEVNRRIFQDLPGAGFIDVTPGEFRKTLQAGWDWQKQRCYRPWRAQSVSRMRRWPAQSVSPYASLDSFFNPCLRMRWHPAPIHLKLIGQKQETPL